MSPTKSASAVPVAMAEEYNSKDSNLQMETRSYTSASRSPKEHCRRQLNDALSSTSINGLSQAFAKTKLRYQLFWMLIFFLGLVAFSINCHSIVVRYLKRPILTQLEREERPFTWPHFTFCSPANPIPFWRSDSYLKKWQTVFQKAHTYELPRYKGPMNSIKIWEHYVGIATINPMEFYEELVKSSIYRIQVVYLNSSIAAFSSVLDLFQPVTDFEKVFETRLDTIRSPIPCFTLMPERMNELVGNLSHGNSLIAIKIYLIMDANSYMKFNMGFENRKLYFYVTNPDSTILSKFPYYMLPGTDSTFLVNQKIHKRVADCTKKRFTAELYDITMVNTRKYYGGFDDCRTFWSQYLFVQKCHCYNPYLPIYKLANRSPVLCTNMSVFDNATMKEKIGCLNGVLSENSHSHDFIRLLDKKCAVYKINPCTETSYSVTRYTTTWQKTMSPDRRKTLTTNSKYLPNSRHLKNVTADFPSENLAILKLEWGKESTQATFEEFEYPFSQLMSDFGGIVGLWIGLSVISVFEIIEIVYKVYKYVRAPA